MRRTPRLAGALVVALVAALVLALTMMPARAGNPRGATYCTANDQVLWFVQTSDVHIGMRGTSDTSRLEWIVGTGRSVIDPSFIVVTGDLTDSTNGNWLSIPNGPYQAEWDQYKNILGAAGMDSSFYYDLPGNHDAYNDRYFSYYLANSIQGLQTGRTQHSWTRQLGSKTYHFLGVNTADNSGDGFSIGWPYGDYAGLDPGELDFIGDQLLAHPNAALTMVFGHHPVTDTGVSTDTWLYYGHQEFITSLNAYQASGYTYGHTHASTDIHFTGDSHTGLMSNGGMRYSSVTSLGKSNTDHYRVMAIDCDGVSSVVGTVGSWPLVLITAPVSKYVGGVPNPYAYTVPNAAANPVRALVFNAGTLTSVTFRVDGGAAQTMTPVATNPRLWQGTWNATGLTAGEHTLQVSALVGSTTRSHSIKVQVEAVQPPVNHAPVAANDSYTALQDSALDVPTPGVLGNDSDPDPGDVLAASVLTGPGHGTVSLNIDGSLVYTPVSGYSGTDSFTYAASDGQLSATATVTITVTKPTTDTVAVTAATFSQRTKVLTVSATSTSQPDVTLKAQALGPNDVPIGSLFDMGWKAKTRVYSGSSQVLGAVPTSVKVTSSGGGWGTKAVQVKK